MSEISKEHYEDILREQRGNGHTDASLIVYTHGVVAYATRLKLLKDGQLDKRPFHVRALECLTNARNAIDALNDIISETAPPCGCEHTRHFDNDDGPKTGHDYLSVPAGKRRAMYVGAICDTCAEECLPDYLEPLPN